MTMVTDIQTTMQLGLPATVQTLVIPSKHTRTSTEMDVQTRTEMVQVTQTQLESTAQSGP